MIIMTHSAPQSTDLLFSSTTAELQEIASKVLQGDRITTEECVLLYKQGELGFLGLLANFVQEKKNGNNIYFNRNFHIEPTNVCIFACRFCSYSRLYKNREEGWELSADEMLEKVNSYDGQPITEVHIVGGVHPKMDIHFFADVISKIKKHRPALHIKAFTAVELDYMFRKAKMNYQEGLNYLKQAGLDSLPGGGAEIFDESIREIICHDKCSSEQWLDIHE